MHMTSICAEEGDALTKFLPLALGKGSAAWVDQLCCSWALGILINANDKLSAYHDV